MVLAWAVALGAATVVGTTAVDAIGSGIVGAGQEPLSQAEVDARLSATPAAPTPPTTSSSAPAPTTTTTATAVEPVVLTSPGGSIIARCTGGEVEVVSAMPAQGFQTRPDPGAHHPSIRFFSGRARVEVRLRCVDGVPKAEVRHR